MKRTLPPPAVALFILLLIEISPATGASFRVSNVSGTFPTLAQAEAAMRAVSQEAANLQFDRITLETTTTTIRQYHIKDIAPNQPSWSDWCNVPGEFTSGQAVCDARRARISWPNPLTYVETRPGGTAGNGEGYRGDCQDLVSFRKRVLGWPQLWRSCPKGYLPKNFTVKNNCGGDHLPEAGGVNMVCGNSLTATITEDKCSIPPLTPLPSRESDPDTYAFEYDGKRVDISRLNAQMSASVACLTNASGVQASKYVTSAWRPPAYQEHMREVWEKWRRLRRLEGQERAKCQVVINDVYSHLVDHEIVNLGEPPAGRNGAHPNGAAIDVTSSFIPMVDALSNSCNVYRPFKDKDKWHVIHR